MAEHSNAERDVTALGETAPSNDARSADLQGQSVEPEPEPAQIEADKVDPTEVDTEEIVRAKKRIRAAVQQQRAAMTEEERAEATDGFTRQLANLVTARGARSISCYLPVGNEPDTKPFIAWAHQQGIEVLMPSARTDGLLDWVRDSGEGIVAGSYGIPEPLGEHLSPLAVGDVDLMLIPASAVDEQGVRLGWGRGYFDRNLGSMDGRPPVFAIVFEVDLLDALPSELHDVPVTGAVTPERIIHLDR